MNSVARQSDSRCCFHRNVNSSRIKIQHTDLHCSGENNWAWGLKVSIAKTVKQYLDNKQLVYDVLEVPPFESPYQAAQLTGIPARSIYYPVVLRDPFGLLMAVLPASHKLDYQRLTSLLNRSCEPAFKTQLSSVFSDCQPEHIPPLGEAYRIRTIIDASLSTPDDVYIVTGINTRLIKLKRKDFMLLQANAWLGSDFTSPVDALVFEEQEPETERQETPSHYLRERVEQITEMPPMPEMAQRIIELRANPEADVADLVKAIELDPSLCAQVLRYANSPYFSYRGDVSSVQVAIARVLGFDMVMNLALGLALLDSFKIPRHGPFGLDAFWKHSIFSANLMQMLGKAMPKAKRPRAATCYLIGQLHDFGYLVLGHLFRDEFAGLSERVKQHDKAQWLIIERDYLGIDHAELGCWLLKAWHLPDELVQTTKNHHEENYEGPHALYVHLCRLSDYLLRVHESGQADYDDIPQDALQALGLTEAQVIKVMIELLEQDDNLETMARRLAA